MSAHARTRVCVCVCVEHLCAKVSVFKFAGGHGIRFQTVPNTAMESDGKQGLITLVYLQRSLLHLLSASDDGSRLSRNPLQVLLLCVGRLLPVSCVLRQSRGRIARMCF